MKHNITAIYKNVTLRSVRQEDIEYLRQWRNDKELSRYLTPLPEITPEMQQEWFEKDQTTMDSYSFIIENDEKTVGSIALYNFKKNTAEFGRFLLSKEAQGKKIGLIANKLVLYIGFKVMNIKKIIATVHQENNAAIITYLKSGFTISGNHITNIGTCELDIYFNKKDFFEKNDFLNEIKITGEISTATN